jgi:hypothetical protein
MNRLLMALVLAVVASCASAAEIEGFELDESAVVDGQKLVLNGAGWRKRGYSKIDVTALYLEQRQSSIEGVMRQPGRKRLLLRPLRDLPGSAIARYFVVDFRQAATDAEFKSLINEVISVGSIFGRLHTVHKGDVVATDWVPGKGIAAAVNGKQLPFNDAGDTFLNSELMFQIILRMHLNVSASEELRMNLLGQSTSMRASTP